MKQTDFLPQTPLLKHHFSTMLDFFFPPICPICQQRLRNPQLRICDECYSTFPPLPSRRCPACGGPADELLAQCRECMAAEERPWVIAVSAFPFAGAARTAIHQFKFRHRLMLADFFGLQLAEAWRMYGQGFQPDAIVPIPLHWLRRLRRGYNQAWELSICLGKELGIPVHTFLRRTRRTQPQSTLNARERQKNLRGVFKVTHNVEGMKLLLLDDVFTTGATLTNAAKTLLLAKAHSIAVITIARDL